MLCREIGIEAYATAGSDDKCDVIAELGATPVNYRTTDFSDFILKQTDGRGVDIILDIMGASYFSRNMRSLGMDGRLVIIGFLGGAFAEQVDLQELALKRAVVTGSTMRARTSVEKPKLPTTCLKYLADSQCRSLPSHDSQHIPVTRSSTRACIDGVRQACWENCSYGELALSPTQLHVRSSGI